MTAPLFQPPHTIEGVSVQPAGTVFTVGGEQVITLLTGDAADHRIWECSLTRGQIHIDPGSPSTKRSMHRGHTLTLLPSGWQMDDTGAGCCVKAGPLRKTASGRLVPEWPGVEHRPMPAALKPADESK